MAPLAQDEGDLRAGVAPRAASCTTAVALPRAVPRHVPLVPWEPQPHRPPTWCWLLLHRISRIPRYRQGRILPGLPVTEILPSALPRDLPTLPRGTGTARPWAPRHRHVPGCPPSPGFWVTRGQAYAPPTPQTSLTPPKRGVPPPRAPCHITQGWEREARAAGPRAGQAPSATGHPELAAPTPGPGGGAEGGGGDTGVLGSRVLCRERNGGRVGWGGCCARGGAMGAVQGRGVRVPCEGVCNGCCEVCGGVSGCCAGWGGMGAVRGGTQDAEDRRRVGEYGLEAAAAQADRDRDPDPGGLRDTRGAGHGGGCAGPGEGGWGCRSGPFKPPPPGPARPVPVRKRKHSPLRPPPAGPARTAPVLGSRGLGTSVGVLGAGVQSTWVHDVGVQGTRVRGAGAGGAEPMGAAVGVRDTWVEGLGVPIVCSPPQP